MVPPATVCGELTRGEMHPRRPPQNLRHRLHQQSAGLSWQAVGAVKEAHGEGLVLARPTKIENPRRLYAKHPTSSVEASSKGWQSAGGKQKSP
eukprot:10074913-Karenia_brevis.AAC.1